MENLKGIFNHALDFQSCTFEATIKAKYLYVKEFKSAH